MMRRYASSNDETPDGGKKKMLNKRQNEEATTGAEARAAVARWVDEGRCQKCWGVGTITVGGERGQLDERPCPECRPTFD